MYMAFQMNEELKKISLNFDIKQLSLINSQWFVKFCNFMSQICTRRWCFPSYIKNPSTFDEDFSVTFQKWEMLIEIINKIFLA